MPSGDPKFGEVWWTSDVPSGRLMQGIVADVSPTRALFVSLTGHRVAVPLSRLTMNWTFVSPAPRRTLPLCERMGCSNDGMIEYDRIGRQAYTCPRHAPTATQCRITANYEPPTEPRVVRPRFECRATPCPTCGDRDPAEDIRVSAPPARLWLCTSCSSRWVTVPRAGDFEQLVYMVVHELNRLSYEADTVMVLQPDIWNELRQKPGASVDPTAAVPRINLRDVQAIMDVTVVPEQFREFFNAILRVRTNNIRQVDRPVTRLGGSPNRGGVVGSQRNPVRPAPIPVDPMIYRPPTGTVDAGNHAVASALHRLRREDERFRVPAPADIFEARPIETPIPEIPIDRESVWVARIGGDTVRVIGILRAIDGSDVISFRSNRGEEEAPGVTMSRRDFLTYHRAYVSPSEGETVSKTPPIEIVIDEEWACQDGSSLRVTQVDFRKEIVHGDDLKTRKHRQIPFTQFLAGRWRKIIRRSVYDRIRNPEINLSPGSDED